MAGRNLFANDATQTVGRNLFAPADVPRESPIESSAQQPALLDRVRQEILDAPGGSALAELGSAISRGAVDVADFFAGKPLQAVGKLTGAFETPTIAQTELGQAATTGQFMEPGLARDVVRTGGELIAPGAVAGQALRTAARAVPAVQSGIQTAGQGITKQLGASTAGQDIAGAALSGVGAELGEATGIPGADIAGSILAPAAGLAAPLAVRSATQKTAQKSREALKAIQDARAGKITEKGAADVAEVISKGSPDEVAQLIKADPEFYRAADELGISTEPLAGFASLNPQFRDVEAALRKVPGSVLDPQAKSFISATSRAADDLIQRYGGTLDKAQLGLDFKSTSLKNIDDLAKQTDDVYSTLKELIPEENRFKAKETVKFLKDLEFKEKIPPRLKRILEDLKPKVKVTEGTIIINKTTGDVKRSSKTIYPTLGKIDQIRRETGQAIHKGSGPFKDVETGLNKALYSRLTKDQDAIAESVQGGLEISNTAKGLVKQRKQIEDNLVTLYGKDLNQALNVNVAGAIKGLSKGQVDKFNEVMQAIPKAKRGEVALSAMNDVFKGSGVEQDALSPTGFVKWFETMNRSPAAKKALFDELPRDSVKAITNLYRVSKGISRSLQQTTPTGRINALFNPDAGFIRKMVGKTIAPAVSIATGSPTASAATNATVNFLRQADDGAKRAADLMASPEFQNIIRKSVEEGVVDGAQASKQLIAAQDKLAKSVKYKKWAETLIGGDKDAVKGGLIRYLFANEIATEDNQ